MSSNERTTRENALAYAVRIGDPPMSADKLVREAEAIEMYLRNGPANRPGAQEGAMNEPPAGDPWAVEEDAKVGQRERSDLADPDDNTGRVLNERVEVTYGERAMAENVTEHGMPPEDQPYVGWPMEREPTPTKDELMATHNALSVLVSRGRMGWPCTIGWSEAEDAAWALGKAIDDMNLAEVADKYGMHGTIEDIASRLTPEEGALQAARVEAGLRREWKNKADRLEMDIVVFKQAIEDQSRMLVVRDTMLAELREERDRMYKALDAAKADAADQKLMLKDALTALAKPKVRK